MLVAGGKLRPSEAESWLLGMQVERLPQDSFLVDSTDSAISPKKRLTNTCKCINISYSVLREWILKVREVKVKKILFHFLFEKWKVKWKSDSLISRMKSEKQMPWIRDREWKVKWKCLEIEIESEKWNENASRSRSRSEISRELSRNSWESRFFLIYPLCVFKCLLKLHTWVNANLHWLHLFEFLHCMFLICPQITYFTMNIKKRPQISYLKGCKATLTTFYLTFPRCVFQMCLQIYILKGCIVTKVALIKTLLALCPTAIFFVLK